MRYELDENGYVLNVFWGCYSGESQEYTGTVPSGYSTLNEWSEKAIINAYYIVDGNLTLDSNRSYKLQLIQKQEAEENACFSNKDKLTSSVGRFPTLLNVSSTLTTYPPDVL